MDRPDFVVDVTEEFEDKMNAVMCFKSQFYDPNSNEPNTPILQRVLSSQSKALLCGRIIGVKYGKDLQIQELLVFKIY